MKAKISSFLLSLLLIYLVFQLSGCSLNFPIGDGYTFDYSMGSTTLNPLKTEQIIVITGDKSLNIKSGTTIDVILRSGRVIKGKYYGMTPIPMEEYSERYAARKEKYKDVDVLPDLGDTVTLVLSDGNQRKGVFFGFDFGAIRFRKAESTMIGTWYMNTLDRIVDNEGRKIESETVRSLMREGKIPFLSEIVLRIKKEESRIEFDDVSQIQIEAKKSNDIAVFVVIGVIGLIIVGALVYALVKARLEDIVIWVPLNK